MPTYDCYTVTGNTEVGMEINSRVVVNIDGQRILFGDQLQCIGKVGIVTSKYRSYGNPKDPPEQCVVVFPGCSRPLALHQSMFDPAPAAT